MGKLTGPSTSSSKPIEEGLITPGTSNVTTSQITPAAAPQSTDNNNVSSSNSNKQSPPMTSPNNDGSNTTPNTNNKGSSRRLSLNNTNKRRRPTNRHQKNNKKLPVFSNSMITAVNNAAETARLVLGKKSYRDIDIVHNNVCAHGYAVQLTNYY